MPGPLVPILPVIVGAGKKKKKKKKKAGVFVTPTMSEALDNIKTIPDVKKVPGVIHSAAELKAFERLNGMFQNPARKALIIKTLPDIPEPARGFVQKATSRAVIKRRPQLLPPPLVGAWERSAPAVFPNRSNILRADAGLSRALERAGQATAASNAIQKELAFTSIVTAGRKNHRTLRSRRVRNAKAHRLLLARLLKSDAAKLAAAATLYCRAINAAMRKCVTTIQARNPVDTGKSRAAWNGQVACPTDNEENGAISAIHQAAANDRDNFLLEEELPFGASFTLFNIHGYVKYLPDFISEPVQIFRAEVATASVRYAAALAA